MHLRATPLLIAVCLAPSVSIPSTAEAQVFLPGKLIRGHAPWESKCKACHAKGKKGDTDPKLCLRCHQPLGAQIRRGRGYHGRQRLFKCAKCHVDHLGRNYNPIRWPGGQKSFAHQRTGYALVAKHKKVACRKCHAPKNIRKKTVRKLSAARQRRTFLGLSTRCGSCHRDPHKGALGTRCQSCHSETGFKPVKHFDQHDRTRFPLVGKHQRLPCAKCHPRSKAGKGWSWRGIRFSNCTDCHKTPHRRGKMMTGTPGASCTTCHTERSWKSISYKKSTHPRVPLRGAHGRAACRKCHGKKANRTPRGTRCVSCHKDPHRNTFGTDCAKCHSVYNWRQRKGSIVKMGKASAGQRQRAATIGISARKVQAVAFHNKTRYPLTGKHIVTPCTKCHGKKRRRRLKKMKFQRCDHCHKDPHRGFLGKKGRRCDSCHETRAFNLVSFGLSEHDKTKMPLRGAHKVVPCAACHPRTTSAARRFRPAHDRCTDCHRDAHRGRFRATPAGKPMPCATCHDQSSWQRHAFDHKKTRFPLDGAHAKAACISCHKADKGITAFKRMDRTCKSCHRDPHQGQFSRKEPKRDCGHCHGSQSFKIPRFDHQKLAGSPLSGGHRDLACKSCHYPVGLKNGRKVRLYRLGTAGCDACHKPRHLQLRKRVLGRMAPLARKAATAAKVRHGDPELRKCETCHVTQNWRKLKRRVANFDHAQTGYPLRGAHGNASCARCHGKKRAVSRQCVSCHKDPHAGKLGRQCADCHSTQSWKTAKALALHRKTRLPLTGWHALADCSSCHPRNRSQGFRGVPAACIGCHAKEYNNPQTHPNHKSVGFGQRCEQCHRPTGWRPATAAARSNQLTSHLRLPLEGGHAALSCVSCHKTGRPTPRCASCHSDKARRVRSPDHRTPGFSTRCESCHQNGRWRPARVPKDHTFPLAGRHKGLRCQDCHTDGTRFGTFSCTGNCHQPRTMLQRHRRERGFSLSPASCKRCHPAGRK